MNELTILMCWHDDPDTEKQNAYKLNKDSFVINNPNYEIISIPNRFENKDKAWLSSDLNVFYWYSEIGHTTKSERFLIVEWDCWCNCNLKEFYNRVWDCEMAGPSVFYPERDSWSWFSSIPQLPIEVRKHATGIVPLNGILLSQNAMHKISQEILKPEYAGFNSEMRLATIASMLNIIPVVNPQCNRTNTWMEIFFADYGNKSLYHPVKKVDPRLKINVKLKEHSNDPPENDLNKAKKIPIHVINLKKRTDRLTSIQNEFKGRNEFSVTIEKAIENPNGALGLWQTIHSIITKVQNEPFVIICEDDHQFTQYYSAKLLNQRIAEGEKKDADFLLGGVSWCTETIQVSKNFFSVENFSATQFVIVFKKFYKQIIEADFGPYDSADYKIASLSADKYVIYPFISTQKEFGYSDATSRNNNYGRVSSIFNHTIQKLDFLNKVWTSYQSILKNPTTPISILNITNTIPTYVINTVENTVATNDIVDEFQNKSEFDTTIVEIEKEELDEYGIGYFLQMIVQRSKQNQDDVIILCDSTHKFTSDYSKEYLLNNISLAQNTGAKIISGGSNQLGSVVPVSPNLYWTDWFADVQFVILTKFVFDEILSLPDVHKMSLYKIYNTITSNKVILYPFISQQSTPPPPVDVSVPQDGDDKNLKIARETYKRLSFLHSEFEKHHPTKTLDPVNDGVF